MTALNQSALQPITDAFGKLDLWKDAQIAPYTFTGEDLGSDDIYDLQVISNCPLDEVDGEIQGAVAAFVRGIKEGSSTPYASLVSGKRICVIFEDAFLSNTMNRGSGLMLVHCLAKIMTDAGFTEHRWAIKDVGRKLMAELNQGALAKKAAAAKSAPKETLTEHEALMEYLTAMVFASLSLERNFIHITKEQAIEVSPLYAGLEDDLVIISDCGDIITKGYTELVASRLSDASEVAANRLIRDEGAIDGIYPIVIATDQYARMSMLTTYQAAQKRHFLTSPEIENPYSEAIRDHDQTP